MNMPSIEGQPNKNMILSYKTYQLLEFLEPLLVQLELLWPRQCRPTSTRLLLRESQAMFSLLLCFHPRLPIAYVVNELSSTVAVFSVDKDLIRKKYNAYNANEDMKKFQGMSTLRLIQSISTVPSAFPKSLNTCGRIAIHTSGRYVLVSNRGH